MITVPFGPIDARVVFSSSHYMRALWYGYGRIDENPKQDWNVHAFAMAFAHENIRLEAGRFHRAPGMNQAWEVFRAGKPLHEW
jgi:hypothetical protein